MHLTINQTRARAWTGEKPSTLFAPGSPLVVASALLRTLAANLAGRWREYLDARQVCDLPIVEHRRRALQ